MIGSLPDSAAADDPPFAAVPMKGPGKTGVALEKLDIQRFLRPETRHDTFNAAGPSAQSTSGWSSYSAAKKTWIIVGIVAGAAAAAVVISNQGDDDNGGGGGY
jgi:hypothetical protein